MPTVAEAFTVRHRLPHSKEVLLERLNVRLYFLADRLTIGGQDIVRVFSVGDIFVAAGLLVTVAELMSPRISLRAPNS
jgi:hypothetical protein